MAKTIRFHEAGPAAALQIRRASAVAAERDETAPKSDIAFTPMVKAIQAVRGSRKAYERMEARGGFHDRVSDDLVAFLAGVDTAYLATANADGQPYAQHRGGPKGFIRV